MVTFLKTLRNQLEETISNDTDIYVVHGGIWSFANKIDAPPQEIPQIIIRILVDIIGPSKTLLMPTYTFNFPKTKIYDIRASKPSTGVLAQSFLNWPKVKRSYKPIFNYAILGPQTNDIIACKCSTAWGEDSIMGWLESSKAQFLSIGVHSLISCTYYHMAEQQCLVPYRYFKKFKGDLLSNGRNLGKCFEVFYVKPLGIDMTFLAKPADDALEATGLKKKSYAKSGTIIEGMNIADIVNVSKNLLLKDPFAMIDESDKNRVTKWIDAGNFEREIAETTGH